MGSAFTPRNAALVMLVAAMMCASLAVILVGPMHYLVGLSSPLAFPCSVFPCTDKALETGPERVSARDGLMAASIILSVASFIWLSKNEKHRMTQSRRTFWALVGWVAPAGSTLLRAYGACMGSGSSETKGLGLVLCPFLSSASMLKWFIVSGGVSLPFATATLAMALWWPRSNP